MPEYSILYFVLRPTFIGAFNFGRTYLDIEILPPTKYLMSDLSGTNIYRIIIQRLLICHFLETEIIVKVIECELIINKNNSSY